MSDTKKILSQKDSGQTLQMSYNDINSTIGVDGFIVGLVGRKIIKTNVSPTVETFSFYEATTLLYTIQITYTDSTKSDLSVVERTV